MLNVIKYPKKEQWSSLLKRPELDLEILEANVRAIINDVAGSGDVAVKKYASRFDGYEGEFLMPREEILEAKKKIKPELRSAIRAAKSNIQKFHRSQTRKEKKVTTSPGVSCWRKSVGIEKVGLYIPGGSAPLFSTVLMLAIPARIAECKEVILCTPANEKGEVDPAIIYAAEICGVDKIFKVGGAQAIAAMAFGTSRIPRVDKIFGPGNQYVTAAKRIVSAMGVAIDMPAGPSELMILADETCSPEFVAADLLSQAEHGPDSQVILVSTRIGVIDEVAEQLSIQLEGLPRKKIALEALKNSKAILVNDIRMGLELVNVYAPEHLIIVCKNEERIAEQVVNAGSVFLGNYSCESAGDYASGTNHTLPTNGSAKVYSGVSVDSFVKKITFQKVSKSGIKRLGKTIEIMAEAEGLRAHKNAVTIRIKKQYV